MLYQVRCTFQGKLAWPLHKKDTQIREAFHVFLLDKPGILMCQCRFLLDKKRHRSGDNGGGYECVGSKR